MSSNVNMPGAVPGAEASSTDSRPADSDLPLRRKAEALLRQEPVTPATASCAESLDTLQATVHELRVHQIELELQNEELRRTQFDLDVARSRYFDLYDLAPVGYCTIDERGLILEVNLTAATLTGVARAVLVGRPFSSFVLGEDQDVYYLQRKRIGEAGAPHPFDLRMLRAGHGPFWAHLEATSARDVDGARVWRLALMDISDRKRMEAALERANQDLLDFAAKLKFSNESLESLVDARTADLQRRTRQLRALALQLTRTEEHERRRVAQEIHDNLQQLLAVIRINIELLSRREDAAQMGDDISRIDELVGQSLAVVRTLTAELSPSVLYRSGFAAALRWLVQWFEEQHGLHVRLTADDVPDIASEELRLALFRSVRELLMNAVKHAGVSTAKVRVGRDRGTVKIVVSDEGIGFDASGWAARDGSMGGLGLIGLRERIESLGGTFDLESSSGSGTRVSIVAPFAEIAERPAVQTGLEDNRPRPGTAKRIRVVVVDDHAAVRDGLIRTLQEEPDIEVVGQAVDGRQSLETVRALRPDVVLMDVSLPIVDGIEATKLICAEFPEVRVIGLSMHDDAWHRGAIRAAGAVDCLDKSLHVDYIVNTVRLHGPGS